MKTLFQLELNTLLEKQQEAERVLSRNIRVFKQEVKGQRHFFLFRIATAREYL